MSIDREVAKVLLDSLCLQLSPSEPFTYASGLRGPIYCDNRQLLSLPVARKVIIDGFVEALKESGWQFDQLAGLATAGIPHCAFVAHELDLPMIYIRSKAKGHGKQNQVEGKYEPGQKVILIEDLVNQGKSLGEAIEATLAAGLVPVGCLTIVTYEMARAQEVLNKFKIPLISLTNFSTIVDLALEQKNISAEEKDMLISWQADPVSWSSKV
ncbi:orotate phosphoribosyltransferase [Halobacteriovorax marinus]|uniref:Orotate phosphoribosyltransferase n=1 Tax=Halobacteriovorax marinus TaxID=97084 RepID=A0A1Y5F770_9BACT|nr:orotate phosphoribosyltransferase [Halobacteriovorax marinus]